MYKQTRPWTVKYLTADTIDNVQHFILLKMRLLERIGSRYKLLKVTDGEVSSRRVSNGSRHVQAELLGRTNIYNYE